MSGPPENAALAELLVRAAGGVDAGLRGQIYAEMLKCRLLVPVRGAPDAQGRVSFVGVQREDGATGLLAFTDTRAVSAWNAEYKDVASIPVPGLFQAALDQGCDAVVLNPAGPGGWDVVRPEFEALAAGKTPDWQPPRDTAVRCEIRAPEPPVPEESVAHVRRALEPHPEVRAAYFVTLSWGAEAPSLFLGLRLSIPSEGFEAFSKRLDGLAEVPGLPEGFMIGPLADEMLPGAGRFGVPVLER